MALNLEAMRAKLEASKNGNKTSNSNKWKPEQGDQTIRILPTKDGDPFKEFHFHYNIGKNPGIMCPKRNYNEECPICDFASKLWKEGVVNNDDTAKREAKKLFVRKRYYSPIIVRGKESEGVKIWAYGKQAYETILGYVCDPDYGDITDVETGTDMVLNYNVPGTPGSFPKTILKPRRRPSVLCDDDVADCEALLESIPDIESQFERKTTADVQALLNESLSADGSEGSTSETHKYGTAGDAVDQAFNKLVG